jgi:hypothetical protein
MEEGGRTGEGWARRRNGGRNGRSLWRVPPGLVGWKVAVGDEAEQSAGGSSSASSLRGADLRGGRLAGEEGFTADGASTAEPHGAASNGARRLACPPHQEGGRVWNWGVRPGGPEAGSGRRLQGGHPDLTGWRLRRRRGDDRARAGAVRRAACAEPICGGSLPSARRLRRETHAGPSHGGSDDGGAPGGCAGCGSCSGATTKARRRGGVCVSELGGARRPRPGRSLRGWAGGLPSYPRQVRRSVGAFASAGRGEGCRPRRGRSLRERREGRRPSELASVAPASGFSPENWLSASGFWLENWLSGTGFWLKNWLSGAGFPLEKGLPGFHARLDGRVAVPAELARAVVVPHAMGQL